MRSTQGEVCREANVAAAAQLEEDSNCFDGSIKEHERCINTEKKQSAHTESDTTIVPLHPPSDDSSQC